MKALNLKVSVLQILQDWIFEKPDYEKFPTVKLAYEMGKLGGTATVCLNAANEEAVFAFLDGKIKLYDIYEITKKMCDEHKVIKNPTIDEIFAVDKEIREKTKEFIKYLKDQHQ